MKRQLLILEGCYLTALRISTTVVCRPAGFTIRLFTCTEKHLGIMDVYENDCRPSCSLIFSVSTSDIQNNHVSTS